MPEVDAVAAHWYALLHEEVALPLSHREASIGVDDAVPWKAFASGGENVTNKPRRFRIDVAVGADKPHRTRADPAQDQLDARIGAVARHTGS